MTKILRCPSCRAPEDELYAEQQSVLIYDVRVNPASPDGIETTIRDRQNQKAWVIGCGTCGEQGSEGEPGWLDGWLIEQEVADG